jgi:hypothetical protein
MPFQSQTVALVAALPIANGISGSTGAALPIANGISGSTGAALPIANGISGSTGAALPIANGCFSRNPSFVSASYVMAP